MYRHRGQKPLVCISTIVRAHPMIPNFSLATECYDEDPDCRSVGEVRHCVALVAAFVVGQAPDGASMLKSAMPLFYKICVLLRIMYSC